VKRKAFHHKGTKINTKGHKEDRKQKAEEEFRRQKAKDRKETKEEKDRRTTLVPVFLCSLSVLFFSSDLCLLFSVFCLLCGPLC
jgi:hypothetical protein